MFQNKKVVARATTLRPRLTFNTENDGVNMLKIDKGTQYTLWNIVASLWRMVLRNAFNNTIIPLLQLHIDILNSAVKLSPVNTDIFNIAVNGEIDSDRYLTIEIRLQGWYIHILDAVWASIDGRKRKLT